MLKGMTSPKPKRRRFQYSFRTMLIVVTLCAIPFSWLAVKVWRAEQHAEREEEVARVVERGGGGVFCSRWSVFYSVESVQLSRTKVNDAWLDHLKTLSELKVLTMIDTQVTDAGLESLAGMIQLETLYLDNTKITDAGLERLSELHQLQTLGLNETQVTNAGLEHLTGLSQLRWLQLGGTRVTDNGVKKLQQALPNCRIDR